MIPGEVLRSTIPPRPRSRNAVGARAKTQALVPMRPYPAAMPNAPRRLGPLVFASAHGQIGKLRYALGSIAQTEVCHRWNLVAEETFLETKKVLSESPVPLALSWSRIQSLFTPPRTEGTPIALHDEKGHGFVARYSFIAPIEWRVLYRTALRRFMALLYAWPYGRFNRDKAW